MHGASTCSRFFLGFGYDAWLQSAASLAGGGATLGAVWWSINENRTAARKEQIQRVRALAAEISVCVETFEMICKGLVEVRNDYRNRLGGSVAALTLLRSDLRKFIQGSLIPALPLYDMTIIDVAATMPKALTERMIRFHYNLAGWKRDTALALDQRDPAGAVDDMIKFSEDMIRKGNAILAGVDDTGDGRKTITQ
jgi:hypothetical protein